MKFIYINQEKHDVGKIRGLNILWVLLKGICFCLSGFNYGEAILDSELKCTPFVSGPAISPIQKLSENFQKSFLYTKVIVGFLLLFRNFQFLYIIVYCGGSGNKIRVIVHPIYFTYRFDIEFCIKSSAVGLRRRYISSNGIIHQAR